MVELDENVELNVDASTEDKPDADYSAKDLQVLEGLEAVRKRPGIEQTEYLMDTGKS